MPLTIDRYFGEAAYLYLPGVDTPIVVTLLESPGGRFRAKLSIDAPRDVYVSRADLTAGELAEYRRRDAAKLARRAAKPAAGEG